MIARTLAMVLALAAYGCAPLPQTRTTVEHQVRASPNFDKRRPNFVILHHTSDDTAEESLQVLTDRARAVSAHYLIARDGRVFSLVDEFDRAWHAGVSYWGGNRDLNSASIGIELDNDGREPYAEPMIDSLLVLLADLKKRYSIPAANFLGHGEVAPGRKVDPSRHFPWQRLAQHGFGLWCDPPYPAVPAGLDTSVLLQALGYGVWNPDAAVAAFKRRFVPDDSSIQVTEKDRSILYCLVLQTQRLSTK